MYLLMCSFTMTRVGHVHSSHTFCFFGTDFQVLSKDIDIFFYTCQVLNFEHGLSIL